MSENNSTPGPWTVETDVRAGGVTHLAVTARHAGRNWMPCSISPMADVRDVDRANANLIAAAPDLRDALQEFLDYSEGGCNPNLEDVYREKARMALAKAKGQP